MRLAPIILALIASIAVGHAETFSAYQQALPPTPRVGGPDSFWLYQNGAAKRVDAATVARSFGLFLPDIELNFADDAYSSQACATSSACLTIVSDAGYAQWKDGHVSTFAANAPRRTDQGLLIEGPSENIALWSRDMTQSVWAKSGMTVAQAANGVDNGANAASLLTATAANATVCQSISADSAPFGEFVYSAFVKRVSGAGEVDIAMNYAPGQTSPEWFNLTRGASPLSASYIRVKIAYDNMSDPVVCVRIVTSGDSVAVDFNQVERHVGVSSPLPTAAAPATRNGDLISASGAAAALLGAGEATIIMKTGGLPAWQFRHQSNRLAPSPSFSESSGALYAWQYAGNALFENTYAHTLTGELPFAICGSISAADLGQSLALPNILGMAWDASGMDFDCDGGGVLVGDAATPTGTFFFGNGAESADYYLADVKLFSKKMTPATLQAQTSYTENKIKITDQVPDAGNWSDYTPAVGFPLTVGGTADPFTHGSEQQDYGIESGALTSGVTSPVQAGPSGNMMRFNLFANNCWVTDICQIGGTGGSERSELDGAIGAGGTAQWTTGDEVWISYSFCVEPGPPITSNWYINGQIHQGPNPPGGSSPALAISGKIGDFRSFGFVIDANQTYTNAYEWPIARGSWERMVINTIMDPTGATGKVLVWKDGVQIVNYHGVTGETPVSGSQIYYYKFGLYRSQSPEYQAARFANTTIHINGASLASKITAPDPIPSGYGTTCQ